MISSMYTCFPGLMQTVFQRIWFCGHVKTFPFGLDSFEIISSHQQAKSIQASEGDWKQMKQKSIPGNPKKILSTGIECQWPVIHLSPASYK